MLCCVLLAAADRSRGHMSQPWSSSTTSNRLGCRVLCGGWSIRRWAAVRQAQVVLAGSLLRATRVARKFSDLIKILVGAISRWLILLRIQSRSGCLRHRCTHPYESMSRNYQPVRAVHALQKSSVSHQLFSGAERCAPARALLCRAARRRSGGLRPCEFGWTKDLAYAARTRLVNMNMSYMYTRLIYGQV